LAAGPLALQAKPTSGFLVKGGTFANKLFDPSKEYGWYDRVYFDGHETWKQIDEVKDRGMDVLQKTIPKKYWGQVEIIVRCPDKAMLFKPSSSWGWIYKPVNK